MEWKITKAHPNPVRRPIVDLGVEIELTTEGYNKLMTDIVKLDVYHEYADALIEGRAHMYGGNASAAVEADKRRRRAGDALRQEIQIWLEGHAPEEVFLAEATE